MPRLLSGLDLDRYLDRLMALIERDDDEFPTREFGMLVSVILGVLIGLIVMIVPVLDEVTR